MIPSGELQQVSENTSPVYRIDSSDGTYFLKELPGDDISKVVDESIGIPPSKVVEQNGTDYLLMEKAIGKPLSMQLPIVLLPGVWRLVSSDVLAIAEQIGRYLGTLHTVCHIGDFSPTERAPRIAQKLSSVTGNEVEISRDDDLPYTKIHGDPTPHNIYADFRRSEANIIDFNLSKSFALEDVVIFETGIILMTGRIPGVQRSKAEEVISAFRTGYISTGPHPELRRLGVFKDLYYTYLLKDYPDQHDRGSVVSRVVEYLDKGTLQNL